MSTQVVVLAGGRATRLGPLAEHTPKVLQPIAGRPFLDVLLHSLADRGVERVHLCLGHLADRVKDHLRSGTLPPQPPHITTSTEPGEAGTAGALLAAAEHLDEVFVVAMGDTHIDLDWPGLVSRLPDRALGLMVVTHHPSGPPPNVAVYDGIVRAYDKRGVPGGLTDTGVTVLRKEALRLVAHRTSSVDLGELFRRLVQESALAAVAVDSRFYDIGTPERIQTFQDRLMDTSPQYRQKRITC
ncbi:NDP-sugar synthase [Streptomyces sp. NPDC088812]|uniref:nucleotidyltransferase family protein n=1 Tax=Streptomyces sp. NPDC088812 TaxID=3365905 RepID=UPI0037F33C67